MTFEHGQKVIVLGSPPRRGRVIRHYNLTDRYLGKNQEMYDVQFEDGRYETAFRVELLIAVPGEGNNDAPDRPSDA